MTAVLTSPSISAARLNTALSRSDAICNACASKLAASWMISLSTSANAAAFAACEIAVKSSPCKSESSCWTRNVSAAMSLSERLINVDRDARLAACTNRSESKDAN